MKFVEGMKDGDDGGILDKIFGVINIFEGQTTDTDVFEFTDFGKIDSEGSVDMFFRQETSAIYAFQISCVCVRCLLFQADFLPVVRYPVFVVSCRLFVVGCLLKFRQNF